MKFLREPLVHFIVAAALVFGLHAMWNARASGNAGTIIVTRAEVERLAALYTSEAGSLPSEADMTNMLMDYVRDEALAREAKRLGLDQGDTIVTRRLAQKMTFMVSDLVEDKTPSDADLREWQAQHEAKFTTPASVTFRHLYFSPSARGDNALPDAEQARIALNGDTPPDASQIGDPFMLQRQFGDTPVREIARLFGGEFAAALEALPVSEDWQGPVTSALGLHLVQVSAKHAATPRPFEDARADILRDWQDSRRREANEAAIADIISNYKVIVEGAE